MPKSKSTKAKKATFDFNNKTVKLLVLAVFILVFGVIGKKYFISHAATGCVSRNYSRGDKGQCVADIQAMLNYDVGAGLTVDGKFNKQTEEAVKKRQMQDNLKANGKVNAATWRSICDARKGPAPEYFTNAYNDANCYSLFYNASGVSGVSGV